MSYTETHFGKFKVLAKGKENIKKYMKEHSIERCYPEDPDDIWPANTDKYYVTYPYEKDGDNYLIEFLEHESLDEGEDFEKFHQNEDGTISFGVQFYNGGCGLEEALGGFYKHINNDN